MPPIDALIAKFFADAAALAPDDATFPYQSAGNAVTPLVDGHNYFGGLRDEVQQLKTPGGTGKFFYFTNWVLGLVDAPGGPAGAGSGVTAWTTDLAATQAFRLDGGAGGTIPPFIDELESMAANGTDVRGLVWVSPLVASFEDAAAKSGIYGINAESMLSVDALRQRTNMANKVCLNTLAHALGAMHLKMVVCGDAAGARGYVAGIDFHLTRVDGQAHPGAPDSGWHDAGARVVGPGVMGIYGWFRQLWNEQISRDSETFRIGHRRIRSYVDGTPSVPSSPPFPAGGGGTARMQVLRTAPQQRYAFGETDRVPVGCIKRLVSGFRRDPWTSAPNGIFAFQAALEKAIAHAENYIYVEDQGFWGQPIMQWLRDRLAARPQLKLIMLHRADPADGPNAIRNTAVAINQHLGSAGVDMGAQVAFFERTGHVVVHSKLWIIDDQLVIVGSANAFRRSLYTDGELSIAVLDEDQTAANVAVRFRCQLWAEHCGLTAEADRASFVALDSALKIWDPSWGGAGTAPASLLPVFQRKRVPFQVGPSDDQWPALNLALTPVQYDQIDADSRLEY
jgi:phosphatidylserine/phosphatidylglycerophosphate/cardiolipin synthase-like enzyme